MANCTEKGGTHPGTPGKACLLDTKQLKWNSFWGMVRALSTTALFAVSYPIYIHFLGLEVFGIWVMLMAVVVYLQLGGLNLPQAASKFISESLMHNDLTRVCQYATSIIGAILGLGGFILLLMLFGRGLMAGFLHAPEALQSQLPFLLELTAVITVLAILAESLGGIVSGAGRMDWVFIIDICCRVIIFLASLPLLYKHYGLVALFYSSIIGYLVYIGLALWCIKHSLGFFPLRPTYFSWQVLRHAARFTGPLLLGGVFSCLLQPFNRILIGIVISPAAASIYDIANRGAQMLRGLIETGLRPLMPQISSLKARADDQQIRLLSLNIVQAIILWATPIFILLFLAVGHLTPLWLQIAAISEVNTNFRIILWGFYANLLSVPIYYAFMGMGQVGRCFRSHIVQTVVNLILASLGIWFIREIWVVSLAVSVGMTISSLDQIYLFLRKGSNASHLMIKAFKTLALPGLVFAPMLALHGHFGLLLGYFLIASMLYVFFLQKLLKFRLDVADSLPSRVLPGQQ
jgi:O-antigen/teichoic acid export membrane protein